ncbi:DUF3307 domain-containing protein [uncultured Sunxiuqinia sp.]|uniref:DUF3307 domain-containing protein n=1 Tax=uncultured Sunxiuqinia sp. TaxID=1573825 RepID=UPI0030DB3FDD
MILLLRLLIAHLIADFLLQPGAWVKDKNEKGIKSIKLFFHVLVVTALSVVFTLDYFSWQIPVLIFLFHYLIDLAKIYFMPHKVNQLVWFLLDQVVHILAIALVVAIVSEFLFDWSTIFSSLLSDQTSLVLFLAYLFVIWPTMIIVNLATKRWQNQIKEGLGPSLPDAGKWIGILERVLVLTFVLTAQFQAIGFLIAAKSILRISVKSEDNARLLSEYVLIGTFISFTIAILTGLFASLML